MDDSKLIEEIVKKNNLAFRALVKKYKKLVYNTAFRLLRNHPDAEDVFQDVFFEVYRSCAHVKNENDLTMWIYKISYNKSISFLRKRNPAKAETQPAEAENIYTAGYIDNETPEQKFEYQESVKFLFKCIDELPDNQKMVLLMHKFEGYSQKDICKKLNLSPDSVESLIYRAKKNLKQKLAVFFNFES